MKTVILCGGSGTRLWPLSRSLFPKQFYPLLADASLFQKTIERNAPYTSEFLIIVGQEQYFMAQDQYQAMKINVPARFILEPEGKNTAPAIAFAAWACAPDDVLLVVPSDHLIPVDDKYSNAITSAQGLALQNQLVTFGMKPTKPETGFGYIEIDGNDVKSFKEKPDLKTAENYLRSGRYFWNSGMFCFNAKTYLAALEEFSPALFTSCLKTWNATKAGQSGSTLRLDSESMKSIKGDSIDYAIMEKAPNRKVVPSSFTWNDLGSFDALYEALPHNEAGNTINPHSCELNSTGNLIISNDRFIATADVENLVIVDTPDALLITKRGSTQMVKDIVGILKDRRPELTQIHTTAHRPWGSYTILEEKPNFKVKRILVKPGARLSLQKHGKRSEHWVVVDGTAYVTIGEKSFVMNRNQSCYIPIGEVHRLENKENHDLVLIEAQIGDYLGEDDIVRLVDDYKRS